MAATPAGGPDLSRLHIADSERAARPRAVPSWAKLVGALALVGLGAAVAWFARAPGTVSPEVLPATAAPVPVAVVSSSTVQAGGRVESSGRRELSFGTPGVVAVVHVARGSQVKSGEVLLELESSSERADVAQMQAALDAATARLLELKEGARPEELEQARRDAEAAAARAADADDKSSQAQRLVKSGATTAAQVLEAQHNADVERARARAAESKLALLVQGTRRTSLTTAAAEQSRARAALAQAQARLELRRLVAPADGTVVDVRTRTGEATSEALPAPVVLTDLAHLEVKVDVPEAKATLVHPQDPATITVEALPASTFTGHVSDVGLEADRQKGTLEVTVAFDPNSALEQVRPRMAARVAIDVRKRP